MLLTMKEWNSCRTDTWTFLLCHSWKAKDALGCLPGRINVPLLDYFSSWVFCLFWSHKWPGVECTIEMTPMILIDQRYEEETVCSKLGFRHGFTTVLPPKSVSSWWPPLVTGGNSEGNTITLTKRINISVWNLYAQRFHL